MGPTEPHRRTRGEGASSRAPLTDASESVDYIATLDCIHCGLCLQTCPTYRLTGVESSSPRGRIHLMRAVGEGRLAQDDAYREELDFCLLCRHCESVCPAGVRFGELMEFARDRNEAQRPRGVLARLARRVGFRWILPRRRVLRCLAHGLRVLQQLRLDALLPHLVGSRAQALASLPRVPARSERRSLPRFTPASAPVSAPEARPTPGVPAQVAILEGCIQPELFPNVGHATVRSLSKLGIASVVPPGSVCCGSLHAHNGDLEGARILGRRVIESFEDLRDEEGQPLPIVMNSAGCGAHLRELQNLYPEGDALHARARSLAGRVVDFSEVVAPALAARDRTLDASQLPSPITWDDPCHLCHAQGVRSEPREILARLHGAELVQLPGSESCCGSAGIYSILRPQDSNRVFEEKLEALRTSGAHTLVTANPGCQIQWQTGLRRAGHSARVIHLAELVDQGLDV